MHRKGKDKTKNKQKSKIIFDKIKDSILNYTMYICKSNKEETFNDET